MWWLYFYAISQAGHVLPHIPLRFNSYLEAIDWMLQYLPGRPTDTQYTEWELRSSLLPEDQAILDDIHGA